MKLTRKTFIALVLTCILALPGMASAGLLDDLAGSLNIQAKADLGVFKAKLGAEFSTSGTKVDFLLSNVDSPADAYFCLKLGHITGTPPDEVLKVYQANKGKGWGVIAKRMGIKPGSPEFHALKSDGFVNKLKDASDEKGGGKGKPKNKGKGK